MTPEVIAKLEEAYLKGCTDAEACFYADISLTTLYNYCEKHEEFRDRKELLKQNPLFKARDVLLKALENGDVNTANKLIDRKEGSKLQVGGIGGGPVRIQAVEYAITDPEDTSS
jgi:hypothetical protein